MLAWSAGVCVTGISGCAPQSEATRANVVLITLDTTRADHLGFYGYERDTSPNLDRLAQRSTVYTRAYATSSWTLPTHASLLTGKFPTSHGARWDAEGPLILTDAIAGPDTWKNQRARGISVDEETLATVLQAEGYATGGFVAGPWMKRIFGLDAGFEHYDDSGIDHLNGRRADDLTGAALAWLKERDSDRPFFLFMNYYDPHSPFSPPRETRKAFFPPGTRPVDMPDGQEKRTALYDAEILFMDREIGKLLAFLEASGVEDDTVVVVTADHGDLLGEAGIWGHGMSLREAEVRIPLLFKHAGSPASAVEDDAPVQQVDVMPMILDELGLPAPVAIQGGVPGRIDRPIVSELTPLPAVSKAGDWRAIYSGELKFLWNSLGNHQLYDLVSDPGEQFNLYPRRENDAKRLEEELLSYFASLPPPGDAGPVREVDSATSEALKGLGYIDP
jgi:arylsulfatase A-like enzyme